jgi:hypothetical protein
MEYLTALDAVIRRGIEGCKKTYKDSPHKLEGSIQGFESCRNKTPEELFKLLTESGKNTWEARRQTNEGKLASQEFWKIRHVELQVEWTCNCMAVWLVQSGMKPPFPRHVGPTAFAYRNMATIMGVQAPD